MDTNIVVELDNECTLAVQLIYGHNLTKKEDCNYLYQIFAGLFRSQNQTEQTMFIDNGPFYSCIWFL